ncbi:MAG TPA: molybdopterin molybdotransferase MoeA [Zoogloea sp.]|uniref:molybdopterin molybdotransferase MoeA n=1 Tax=Zoogloea sp. TaxID=49181 RepID=UPI002C4053D9|nr:gephyrin-like molybdotransferase Glp [Zoogloea sp.]HMV61760.1 molybdopterin molybdotransferase MoeA [Rhodocyclaceae bacterium]HMW51148.1 molybdopterin molybdotransferase MoeA [Rhodocyclaceae bacterium]HMY48383.1 molybdopterin molybdotransferase MoeA [Rhodocyclaceae bacterium]HNA66262.1 molybdopterin molybdotransferase MoeA [Rhodocyclaceae bacterium]HNB63108.1 molybdopterin molybdotransferase MoeA [Rhodocyclaceae bacterium]
MSQDSGCAAPSSSPASLTVDAARRLIFDRLTPVGGYERIALRAALGRILAEPVIAPCNVPAHDNSAMDGYAIRADDLPESGEASFQVVGTAYAGRGFSGIVGAGQAVRIMTGAVVPMGADTIVVQEIVQTDGDRVVVPPGQRRGQNLRRAGEDLALGAIALPAGKRLGPAELGLVASLGIAEVSVTRRLRVAFFSTGDELASIGRPLAPGEVYDSNRYTLFGALTRLGCDLLDMGVIRDEPESMETAFREAARHADVIITTGGVSVGEADFIRDLMARLGEVSFWKLEIKPGRPMAFGRLGSAWMFGLPGNPVAVMVTFYQFVQDALLHLGGLTPLPERPLVPAECADAIRKQPGRREFLRGRLSREDGIWKVRLSGAQGSGILRSMSEANCFIVLEETRGNVAPGDAVSVQLFDGLI